MNRPCAFVHAAAIVAAAAGNFCFADRYDNRVRKADAKDVIRMNANVVPVRDSTMASCSTFRKARRRPRGNN
jgi:hypothetical protein